MSNPGEVGEAGGVGEPHDPSVESTAEAYALLLRMDALQVAHPLSRHDAEVAIGRRPQTNDVRTWGALLLSDPRDPLPQRIATGRQVLDALCCVMFGVADFRAACTAPHRRQMMTTLIPYLKGLHDAAWTQTLPRPPLPAPLAAPLAQSAQAPSAASAAPATSPESPIVPTSSATSQTP